ncbi:hypothetical protein V6N12_046115 [Hibiscus sabdariffa]|uniref:Uncharacterized protein n=1 Tax=Hibiscus sabdariffa TaxID=183260 RepID=A0ABR2G4N6_9ROSI
MVKGTKSFEKKNIIENRSESVTGAWPYGSKDNSDKVLLGENDDELNTLAFYYTCPYRASPPFRVVSKLAKEFKSALDISQSESPEKKMEFDISNFKIAKPMTFALSEVNLISGSTVMSLRANTMPSMAKSTCVLRSRGVEV